MYNIDVLIGLLVSKFRLTQLRLEAILKIYINVEEAVEDNFIRMEGQVDWVMALKEVELWTVLYADFFEGLETNNVKVLSIFSAIYPVSLSQLSDKPIVIFYQGDVSLIHSDALLTVVGSRNHTRYTEKVIEHILVPAICTGVVVVSGLAVGIDALAHRAAVENKQKTIAVIGSGLDDTSFYPSVNLPLKKQILESGGLIISEYPIGFAATKFSFPRRNRILAALSTITWIVEAGKKSGSLITAQEAQKLGRKVITTLAPLFEDQFVGNIELFRSGSKLVSRPEDILEELGIFSPLRETAATLPTDSTHLSIYSFLDTKGKQVELLSEQTGIQTQELMGTLSIMELEGYVENIGQNVWVKK